MNNSRSNSPALSHLPYAIPLVFSSLDHGTPFARSIYFRGSAAYDRINALSYNAQYDMHKTMIVRFRAAISWIYDFSTLRFTRTNTAVSPAYVPRLEHMELRTRIDSWRMIRDSRFLENNKVVLFFTPCPRILPPSSRSLAGGLCFT